MDGKQTTNSQSSREEASEVRKIIVMINYRGKVSEDYARSLHRINAPCNVIMTLRKLKTVLPSLKPSVEKFHKSGVVYKLDCPCCNACYVGQTSRHLLTRFKEHCNRKGPVKSQFLKCKTKLTTENVSILHQTSRGENYLLTLDWWLLGIHFWWKYMFPLSFGMACNENIGSLKVLHKNQWKYWFP